MKTRASINEEQLVGIVEDSLEQGDAARVESLRAIGNHLGGRETALRRERARRAAKYGMDSPKTMIVDTQLAHTANLRQDVLAAALAADFKQPEADSKLAILHGRVVDQTRSPVASATVVAMDKAGAVVATSQTDAQGYYKLDLPKSTVPERVLTLRVTDKKKNVLLDSRSEIAAAPGTVQFRLVAVNLRANPPSTPPSAPTRAPEPVATRARPAKSVRKPPEGDENPSSS